MTEQSGKLAVMAEMDISAEKKNPKDLYDVFWNSNTLRKIYIIALYMMPSTLYSPLCWNMCADHLRYTGLHLKHISTTWCIFSHLVRRNKHQE